MASHKYLVSDSASRWMDIVLCFLVLGAAATGQVSRVVASPASPAMNIKPYQVLLVVEHGSDAYDLVVSGEGATAFNLSRRS